MTAKTLLQEIEELKARAEAAEAKIEHMSQLATPAEATIEENKILRISVIKRDETIARLTADLARVRAETVEECARVLDERATYWGEQAQGRMQLEEHKARILKSVTAGEYASAIRSRLRAGGEEGKK